MTVSTTNSAVTYTGDGTTTAFPVPYPFFDAGDLEVIERNVATGAETTRSLTTDYAVAGGQGTTGTVTAASAPAATVTWTIRRVTPQTQLVDYTPNDPFPADTHEAALDRCAMRDQELSTEIGRCFKVPKTDSASSANLPGASDRANKYMAFDAGGNPIASSGPTGTSNVPVSSFMQTALGSAGAQSARDTLLAAGKPGSETAHRLALWSDTSGNLKDGPAEGSAGYVLTSAGSGADPAFQPLPGSFRNLVANGNFLIWQRGTSFSPPTSGSYTADRWKYNDYSQNNVANVTRETSDVPPGAFYALKSTVATANKKFTLSQVLESLHSVSLRGQTVTLSAKLKVSSATLGIVKMAILSSNFTADNPANPVFGAANGEGTNPTLSANWSYVNTPANLGVGTAWATYQVSGTVPADCNNLAIAIWSDDTSNNVGDILRIADVQLEVGASATGTERPGLSLELVRCQRYYQKSFPYATAPAQNAGLTCAHYMLSPGASNPLMAFTALKVTMRTNPSVTFYNPSAANGNVRNTTDNADSNAASVIGTAGDSGFAWGWTGTATDNIYDRLAVHWTAEAEF